MKQNKDRLFLWQDRLSMQEDAYNNTLIEMETRESLYQGDRALISIVTGDTKTEAVHVRNIIAECIEAQVDANVPQPKVTAQRKEDEPLAEAIEAMLRNELDRLPFEIMNDMMSRTVPIQGAGLWLIEWDNTQRTHKTVGDMVVSTLHPKQVIPQDGVYDKIEDMDYIIVKLPQTKEYINRKYGISMSDEAEAEPEVKGSDADDPSTDMVTQYIAFYRNDKGGIGLYSWVNDTELEDLEDYQARKLKRCTKCGAVEPNGIEPLKEQTVDGTPPDPDETKPKTGACSYCGSTKFEQSEESYEEVYNPIMRNLGPPIPGATMQMVDTGEIDEYGMPVMAQMEVPTRIPYYKPDIYPVVIQRNVSVFGQFLGESDVDKIADQQNTTNIIHGNIIDKLLEAGSILTLPPKAHIKIDPKRKKVYYVDGPADMSMIQSISLDESIEQDMAYLEQVYQEARQAIGITDSFQGRTDRTATSGKAKEFAAAQSAGRLESKRVMKDAAFAYLFEAMFKFKLAYADEARPIVSQDIKGKAKYGEFNRYDFLAQDEAGEWYWNDRFLFSCDTSSPLASNREAMWQETRLNLQTGAFGDPTNPQTQILFWTIMEQLHYPISGQVKQYLEEMFQQQQAAMMQQQQMMMAQQQMQNGQAQAQQQSENDMGQQKAVVDVKRQAREDAIKTIQAQQPMEGK